MWPDARRRVLASAITRAEALSDDVVEQATIAGATISIPRFAPIAPTRRTTGEVDGMSLYAGLSLDGVRRVQPAAEVVRELVEGGQTFFQPLGTTAKVPTPMS